MHFCTCFKVPSLVSFLLSFTILFYFGLCLDPRAGPDPPPAPRPPRPRPIPLGPDNFPIPGSNLQIRVDRPWGEVLATGPTIVCLAEAQNTLTAIRTAHGDISMPLNWGFERHGIKIGILRIDESRFFLTEAITLLRGMVELINQYPEMGAKAVRAHLFEMRQFGPFIALLTLSRRDYGAVDTPPLVVNGTYPPDSLNSTTALTKSTNLTRIDPTDYRIPNTAVTVALIGQPPYGPPLPKTALILFLTDAQLYAARQKEQGHDRRWVVSNWTFEQGGISLYIRTELHVDCKYSELEIALSGISDIIREPGGVGAVAAKFTINVDGKGEVARGTLKWVGGDAVGDDDAVSMGSATLVEQYTTATKTLTGGALETGDIAVA